MTDEKKAEPAGAEKTQDKFKEDFKSLPLDKKFASLFQLEAMTLSETFDYVVSSSSKVVEKVGDAIADFGTKLENEVKKATGPTCEEPKPAAPGAEAPKPKRAPAGKASTPPRAPKG